MRLLPEYDVYVMGFRERDQLIPEPVRELIASHRRGRYEGPAATRIVLVDGVAAGLWERRSAAGGSSWKSASRAGWGRRSRRA